MRCRACAARVHVFRVLISSMLAIVTVMLMDMANTQFYAYYMCAHHRGRTPGGLSHACLDATLRWQTQQIAAGNVARAEPA